MANIPTPDQAEELARKSQEQRIAAVRALAHARHALENARETESAAREALEAEYKQRRKELDTKLKEDAKSIRQADTKAYRAALKAGWSEEELKRIGFTQPTAQRRQRSRRKNIETHVQGDTSDE